MLLDTCGGQKKKFHLKCSTFNISTTKQNVKLLCPRCFVICDYLKEFHIDYYYIYCIQCANSTQCLFSGLCYDP